MEVIGTSGGGYATVLPTQGNPLGDAMANVENSAFRYSAQKMAKERMKQDAERDLYDRRRQEFADAQQFSKENPFVATGMDIDGANMQGYMNFKDAANNAQSEFNKTGDPKYKSIHMNAVAGAKAIGEMPKTLNAVTESWDTDPTRFNQESLKNKRTIVAKIGSGGAVPRADEYGRPLWDLIEKDDNGNIIKVVEKGVNSVRMKKLLEPVPNFNIDGTEGMKGDSLVKTFNENIGKERKTTVIKNGKEVETTFNPGSEDLAKIMAAEAVQDKDKLYNVFTRIGVNAEDEKSYENPENIKKAQDYLTNKLIASAPTTVSEKPNYEAQKIAQTNRSQAETARHNRAMENKGNKESIPTTFTRHITTTPIPLGNSQYVVPIGSGKLMINSEGFKDKSGATRILQEAFRTPKGSIYVGINEKKVNYAKLTPEAKLQKQNDLENFDPKNPNNYEESQKVNYYNLATQGDKASLAILNTVNPESKTGEKFKNQKQLESWIKKNTNPNSGDSKPKPKAIQFDAQGNIIM